MHNESFDAFQAEVAAVLAQAGYRSPVLKIAHHPGNGWTYDCLAMAPDRFIRRSMLTAYGSGEVATTADELLRLLRQNINASSFQTA